MLAEAVAANVGTTSPAEPEATADYLTYLEESLLRQRELLAHSRHDLNTLRASRAWRILQAYFRLRDRLAPPDSWRRRAARSLVRGALAGRRLLGKLRRAVPRPVEDRYLAWIKRYEPKPADLDRQRHTRFDHEPTICLIVPTRVTCEAHLLATVRSVQEQTYSSWQLCLIDRDDPAPAVRHLARTDPRIRVTPSSHDQAIVGEYVALLGPGDVLAPFALFEVVRAINDHPQAEVFYSDNDTIDESGARRSPHFKPDFNPELLRGLNYIAHLCVFCREFLTRIDSFRPGFEGAEDYDLILRAAEQARQIVHIPKVLYHGRSAVPAEASESGRRALLEHLRRQGQTGASVQVEPARGIYRIRYPLARQPQVSIIIPNRDHAAMLERCLHSVQQSSYRNYEVVIVENHSQEEETFACYRRLRQQGNVRVLTWDRPFNYSAVNNHAVRLAGGEVLLFLNNDVEAIHPDWMERLLEHALRPDVGAVGAKLYYPNDTVQHGGVILGIAGSAAHVHTGWPRDSAGYFGRLVVPQDLMAVTGACLMTRRDVFEEVGGFDERFRVAFNDLDLCLKLRRQGYRVLWTPHAELYHHESVTRGNDLATPTRLARYEGEEQLFRWKWHDLLARGDPYYNPNLGLDDGNFTPRGETECTKTG
jgi:GT2 family glycosyltransferase